MQLSFFRQPLKPVRIDLLQFVQTVKSNQELLVISIPLEKKQQSSSQSQVRITQKGRQGWTLLQKN